MNILDRYSLDEKATARFDIYYHFLIQENEKYNLTSITAEEDVYVKHFADSLTGAFLIPIGASVLDVGAGAGFPSVPLLIARPDIRLTMIDSVNKKINFLKELLARLDLHAEAIHTRIEDCKSKENYDIVVSRAVAALPTLLEYTLPFVKIGGRVLAYKTHPDEADTAQPALAKLGGAEIQAHDVSYLDSKRIIFEITKIKSTPPQYPRGGNKPRINPL